MNSNDYLYNLVMAILGQANEGISKVKLAKLLYFAHKELVRLGISKPNDLVLVRMPLGPVPRDMRCVASFPNVIVTSSDIGLRYNRETYSLLDKNVKSEFENQLSLMLKRIVGYSTSDLVAMSHKDISWNNHKNGEEYVVDKRDLYPIVFRKQNVENKFEDQKIQSLLIKGMVEDIVADSTGLEYPTK